MKKSEFIEKAYKRADKAGRIDDEVVIRFYLEMFLEMGMLAPEVDPIPQEIIDNCESANYWEDEDGCE